GETHRRRVGHQIGHLPVKRAIDDYAQGTLAWVVFGNEKHGAPEIWIEHVGMSNQQRTSKTARERAVPQLTHVKLETPIRSRATRHRWWFCVAPGCLSKGCENFHIKFCCHQPEARLLASKVFYDCSGGNSRPSRPSGVGGGNFFRTRTAASFFLLFLGIMLLLDCALKQSPSVQRRTSNVEVSKPSTRLMAARIHTNGNGSRDRKRDHLFARRDLAGAHGAAKRS